ncbi:uncharacterized protein BX664DRAFT_319188 [Halteromyces radiatus]|uniref:uncharacterized protein n=1 Tax=Halteromyces radiatus TaxID=101107 RepID=UPI00221F377A|nr:uncharacterized protein BX664DRAFT_319188 [Halteromyces radiatus]KAI8098624.1 hypothetical protein BX664DRAFT_319188 [Halteromyces radiatus]
MGCCLSSQSNSNRTTVTGGKPFRRNNIQWTSDIPITHTRLLEQRSTFWETAPFYEGRPEIWQAIQAAITCDDIILAQSILDAANIKLPTGNPADGCYDELGTRYDIPLYCLVDPTNLLPDEEEEEEEEQHDVSSMIQHSSPIATSTKLQKTISSVSSMIDSSSTKESLHHNDSQLPTQQDAGDHPIIIRLSTGKDIPLKISATQETVPLLKSRIFADPNAHLTPDTHHLRLIYLGKILDDHTSIIGDFTLTTTSPLEKNTVKLRAGAVVQALVISKES